jgi:hypothetical protein
LFKEGCLCKKNKKDKKFIEINKKNEMLDYGIQQGKGVVKEWSALCKNAEDYISFKKNGTVLGNTQIKRDSNDNVVALQIPTSESANQKKLLKLQYDHMLDTDCQTKRWAAKIIAEDTQFCNAVNVLRRQNALSDADALEEALENIVSNFPNVLYLTQDELATQIKEALESINATNYDDQVCDFMAEGILRTAQQIYPDKVEKIVKLAGTKLCDECDQYESFQNIVGTFYTTIDENIQREMSVYADLYETLRKIHESSNENMVKVTTAGHLTDLAAVLQGELQPNVAIVEEATQWLLQLVETNLAGGVWTTSKPHCTVNGDHPAMTQKARQSYTPSADASGDWGDSAPVSDGKNYRGTDADEMRNRGAGNWGSSGTYPELQNPYIPKPFGEYTVKGEKGVDQASDATSQWSSGDTWPALQNPYLPKSDVPEMNMGKEEDLVSNS